MIPALILAAGSGRRMGGPKARLVLDGETLLQRTARIAQAAGCTPVIAVVGDWDPGALDPSVRVVRNPEATEGMASSIRRGIAALPGSAPAVLLLVIDQPAVEVSLLRRLLPGAADPGGRPGRQAHPPPRERADHPLPRGGLGPRHAGGSAVHALSVAFFCRWS